LAAAAAAAGSEEADQGEKASEPGGEWIASSSKGWQFVRTTPDYLSWCIAVFFLGAGGEGGRRGPWKRNSSQGQWRF